jgi:hypothetical protein
MIMGHHVIVESFSESCDFSATFSNSKNAGTYKKLSNNAKAFRSNSALSVEYFLNPDFVTGIADRRGIALDQRAVIALGSKIACMRRGAPKGGLLRGICIF